jgi:hypothetical protein
MTPIRKSPSGPVSLAGEGVLIAWRPDGSGDAVTWGDVVKILNANVVSMLVDVSPEQSGYVVPPGEYDFRGGGFSAVFGASRSIIDVQDGASFIDLSVVAGSVVLDFHPTSAPALVYTASAIGLPGILSLQRNGTIRNSGTVPLVRSDVSLGGPGIVLASFENGGLAAGSAPILDIAAGAVAIFLTIGSVNIGDVVPSSLVSGPIGSTLWLVHDGTLSFPFPAQPAFLGSISNLPLGCSPSGGPTALRPSPIFPLATGVSYFDTGIVPPRPVWWDGAAWVDATGTPA